LLVGSCQSTLAADATTLTLREATPDAELLTLSKGVFQTVFADDAALDRTDFASLVGRMSWKEQSLDRLPRQLANICQLHRSPVRFDKYG
jgi:hypothetical protein